LLQAPPDRAQKAGWDESLPIAKLHKSRIHADAISNAELVRRNTRSQEDRVHRRHGHRPTGDFAVQVFYSLKQTRLFIELWRLEYDTLRQCSEPVYRPALAKDGVRRELADERSLALFTGTF
jgi:hypothetical protein